MVFINSHPQPILPMGKITMRTKQLFPRAPPLSCKFMQKCNRYCPINIHRVARFCRAEWNRNRKREREKIKGDEKEKEG